jgi:hypothetical protein
MPLRFFRRVRIAPGVSINLSKSGASVSVGPRGAKVTVGPKGVRTTVGLPGTGVYYTTAGRLHELAADTAALAQTAASPKRTGLRGFWARRSRAGKGAIVVAAVLALSVLDPSRAVVPTPALSGAGAATAPTASAGQPLAQLSPNPATNCHPSYSPCLPVVADLNCPDVRAMGKAPVRVIGPDAYHLDRDHDGIGCE